MGRIEVTEIELTRLAAALRGMPDEPVESIGVASWLQHDDGTWSPVYESGRVQRTRQE